MNAWQLALLGILLYWLIAAQLDRQGYVPEWISVSGPLTTLHTQRGKALIERLSRRERFWRAWANVGVGIALVVMFGAFFFVVLSGLLAFQNPEPTAVTQPRNVVAIPGVNDFLPLSAAAYIVAGLVIGLIVHEGGHGLLCRVEDIEIESMGLAFLALIPMGAFVEPDQESQAEANRGARTRMFAAGVTNNLAITVLAFALLFGPVAGAIGVAGGAHVGSTLPGSPADDAGLDLGDRITAVDGQPVADEEELQATLAEADARSVTLEVDGEREVALERSVYVTGAATATGIDARSRVTAVDGTEVHTVAGYRDALAAAGERATLTLEGEDGTEAAEAAEDGTEQHTVTVGPRVTVAPDGGMAAAGAPEGGELTLVSVGGQRVVENLDVASATEPYDPGDEVTVVGYDGDERVEYDVTLGGADGDALLGVRVYPGVAGVTVDDLGLQYYPSERYLAIFGGDADASGLGALEQVSDSALGTAVLALFMPFAAIAAGQALPFNFAGFVGDVTSFFEVTGPLAPAEPAVFVLANVLFWTAWINFNLAFFNCIPAFPLDGGHILRTATESIVARLPIDSAYAATKVVTVSVGLTMLLSLVAVVAAPQLLG